MGILLRKRFKKKKSKEAGEDLKIAGVPPIEDFPEEITGLAKREEKAVAEICG